MAGDLGPVLEDGAVDDVPVRFRHQLVARGAVQSRDSDKCQDGVGMQLIEYEGVGAALGGGILLEGHVADRSAKIGEAHVDEAVPELCHGRPGVVGLGGGKRGLLGTRRRGGSRGRGCCGGCRGRRSGGRIGLRGDLLAHLVPDVGRGRGLLRMLLRVKEHEERRDEQQRTDQCVPLVHGVRRASAGPQGPGRGRPGEAACT